MKSKKRLQGYPGRHARPAAGQRVRPFLAAAACLAALAVSAPGAVRAGETGDRLESDVAWFAAHPSRLPGQPGNAAAADFIEARFRSLGLENVSRETYPVVVPQEREPAWLTAGGQRVPLHSLWPNHVRTSRVPREGLRGRLICGGDGQLDNYRGLDVDGAVVLLDFNSGTSWLDAGMLGAAAVVFVAPEETTIFEARRKFLEVPIDLPRFYVDRAAGEALRAAARAGEVPAVLTGRQGWERVEAANILAWIPGSDPELAEEIIAFSAYYDSMSVVPGLAPGADQASGAAALLSLAEHFSVQRPKRTLLFLATGCHFQNLRGMDDFVNRHFRTERQHERLVPDPLAIRLMVSLEMSSHSDELAVWHNSAEFDVQRYFAPFVRQLFTYLPEQFAGKLLNGVSPERGMAFESFLPENIRTAGVLAIRASLPTLSFVTARDNRRYFDTPLDTVERVDFVNLRRQTALLKELFGRGLNDEYFLPDVTSRLRDTLRTLNGRIVYFDPRSGFVPNEPVPGAIVAPRFYEMGISSSFPNRKSSFGVRGNYVDIADEEGRFTVTQMPSGPGVSKVTLEAFALDPGDGSIVMAPDRGVNGDENYPMTFTMDTAIKDWMIVLFDCVSANVYDFIDPRYLVQLDGLELFDPSDSIPTAYGLTYHEEYYWQWTSEHEPAAVVHAEPGMRIKITGETGPLGKRILMLNSPDDRTRATSEGIGFDLATERGMINHTSYRAARDMIQLNSFRINNFARFGIVNERLSELHGAAREWVAAADEALEARDWQAFVTASRRAVGLESRAYPDVRATTNDVIIGLIFYFVILLPFAFFFERLIFGFVDIRKQIVAIFIIFLVVYTMLRFVHPGFQLSDSPEVILLGFIVLTLSGVVISLVSGKFEEQMQQLKRERVRVYETDVGRVAATGTAYSLGMANMKRRKLRTTLTAVTLILLTFTVLSFTSITSFMRFSQVRRPYAPSYEGLLIRDPSWGPLEESRYQYVSNEFAGRGTVAPRAWFMNPNIEQGTYVGISAGGNEVYALALLGMSPEEPAVTGLDGFLVAGRWFESNDEAAIILPDAMAGALGLDSESVGRTMVSMFGEPLLLAGIVSSEELNRFIDLDGARTGPVNFSAMPDRELDQLKMERTARVMSVESAIAGVTQQDAANVPILPYDFLRRRGGNIHSIAVRINPDLGVRREVEEFVSRLAVTLYAGYEGRTFVYSSHGLTSFTGVGNLIIPILIASLIVLNTMLGAVYERIKEIGIYSSVGLAPSHISALFFAEASVYAVIGAVAGYLLGQLVTRGLSAAGMLQGLTLNYSSLSAVMSTLVVMATVFLSTIFPARKASELSVPDVTRKWVLPRAEGDDWRFDFPFTVGKGEVLGLMVFLRDYFESFSIESVGTFYTEDTSFKVVSGGTDAHSYVVSTRVHLAPFDLGVRQRLNLTATPIAEFTFYTIKVQMLRETGEANDWQRLNRRFLNNIRKQFLVWRTIDPAIKASYRKEGEKLHGK